jgi:CO/xanthine dehydrogenase Mo-binding subunit
VPADAIRVEDGRFLGPDGREVGSYWALAGAGLLETEASLDAEPKPAAARAVAGRSVPRLDLPDKVFGAARFVHDLRLPGTLHARVVRPPARRARLVGLREGTLPGGARVVRDGDFLAVLADAEWHAEAAAARVASRAEWAAKDSLPEQSSLEAWLDDAAARGDRGTVEERGAAPGGEARRIARRFTRPFLAHASVGTCCAVARWRDDGVEVWTHSQGPYNLRADIAKALRCAPELVLVRHAEGAGCYGHNGADDVALEAVLIARAAGGRPVRLVWSRAEELAWAPLSPAMLVDVEASVDAGGDLLGWRGHVVSNGHSTRPGRAPEPALLAASMLAEPFAVRPAINPPLAAGGGAQRNAVPIYRTPSLRVETTRLLDMPIRASALRALGATLNVWAIESVMDELAALAGSDPLDYRLRHLDDPRAAAVLRRVASMAGWTGRPRREGVGLGLGMARYKNTGSYAAVVAEVDATAERARCRRLWVAGDVGEAINPDGVANQLEGGAVHGASVALLEEARFDRRGVTSDAWERYPVLRFSEVPEVAVELVVPLAPDAPPLGAGEASMAPTVAAIAGAIHEALGVRPRRLPFTPENLSTAMAEGDAP